MFKIKKITASVVAAVLTLLTVFISPSVLSHEGHGVNAIGHDLEHMLWLGLAVTVVLIILYRVFKNKNS